MRSRLTLLASFALLGFSLQARASDLDFNVTGGTLTPSGTFSGSFLINTSTYAIDGGSFTVDAGASIYTFSGQGTTATPGLGLFTDTSGDTFRLALYGTLSTLTVNTLAGFGTGGDTDLTLANGSVYAATGGSVVSAATPEPSSLALLGTGVLALAGLMRRRLLA